jgi:hypothetical protein
MTYGRVESAFSEPSRAIAVISHLAELVRGKFAAEGPLIRPFGAPSPQGEKGWRGRACEFQEPTWLMADRKGTRQ